MANVSEPDSDLHPTPEQQEEAAARKLVEHCYLRVMLGMERDRRSPGQLNEGQRAVLLASWQDEIRLDTAYSQTVMEHMRLRGIEQAHGMLHQAEGIDHEMIDQAAEFAERGR